MSPNWEVQMSILEPAEDLNTRIEARAHQIWEQEGRPDGREKEHWEQAQREISEEHGSEADPDRKAEIQHADAFAVAFGKP
jgi:hypothetical protein